MSDKIRKLIQEYPPKYVIWHKNKYQQTYLLYNQAGNLPGAAVLPQRLFNDQPVENVMQLKFMDS